MPAPEHRAAVSNWIHNWIGGVRIDERHAVYTTPTLPEHWIALGSDHTYYLFPAVRGGWAARRPYRGPTEGLTLLAPQSARSVAVSAGGEPDFFRTLDDLYVHILEIEDPEQVARGRAAMAAARAELADGSLMSRMVAARLRQDAGHDDR